MTEGRKRWVFGLKVHLSDGGAIGLKPSNSLLEPLAKRMLGLKTDRLFDAADVQTSARLAVRLRLVPYDTALVAEFCGNHERKALNRDLLARSQIERERIVVLFRSLKNPFCSIFDLEKFASRCPVSP